MKIVIVGGGLAAANAAAELRDRGHLGELTVFADEAHLPYERPPLSKGVLLGKDEPDSAIVHAKEWYADHDVDLRTATAVDALDLDTGAVLAGEERLVFDRLLLATGSRPRHLAMADESGAPVAYLRTFEDSAALKSSFGEGRRLVIIGGGWIGLEVAAAAREAGTEVTIVESLELPLLRVLGPEVAGHFADLHRSHGVDLRLSASVTSIDADGTVHLADGEAIGSDLIVVGIGVEPVDDLARAAGLSVDNGILVGQDLRSSDPRVFAAGDVANQLHPTLGRRIRVEHWDTAIHQGRHAARVLLGEDVDYDRLPYFFTDQYDLGMEYVGSVGPDGYTSVEFEGDPASGTYRAFWIRDGLVVAGMHVNDWDATDEIRAAVGKPR
ncbi:NAD(P)/FAD-dependent oxidoreductase [Nocardioides sp. Root151]|uniref:NAD(P)/FAD-dependent oxidoreductase n=1 Tax=Nocardioides sp. Root151 TaxID=1736475 RepID=UPI0007037F3E|nr:FAD-dependent oxidoreductase [Nocardioides sp. Root151]KQZ70194.1 pyridine nucleotide-disulfide oxidoreductase [Nocardioides sp. Root151]